MRATVITLVAAALGAFGCGGAPEQKEQKDRPSAEATAKVQAAPTESEPAKKSGPAPTVAKESASTPKLTIKTAQGKTLSFTSEHDPWADKVTSFTRGKPVPKVAGNPAAALGRPDCPTGKKDASKYVAIGHDGQLVLEFTDNVLVNGPGDDLAIFSVGANPKPIEVSISVDGADWISLGRLEDGKSTIDIGSNRAVMPGQQFRFVKIVDGRGSNPKAPTGAEIDAVGAINSIEVKQR